MSHVLSRGTLYHVIARLIFMASTYGIHVISARYLGPDNYGVVGIILAFSMVFRMILMRGLFEAVSTFTAGKSSLAYSIRNMGINIQLVFSSIFFAVIYFLAPQISLLLNSPELTYYLRLLAPTVILMGLCSIYIASINGHREFGKEAIIIAFYSIVRIATVVILFFIGFKVESIIFGFIIAYGAALILARIFNPIDISENSFSYKQLINFSLPVIISSLALGLIMNMDLFMVKAILGDNSKVGFYTSASIVAKIPFFIFSSILFTLLPSISKAYENNNQELVKSYICQTFRYVLMVLIPMVCLLCATSKEIVTFIYSSQYIEASEPLPFLIVGFSFLILYLILNTIITGIGKPKYTMIIICSIIPINIVLNSLLVPKYGLIGAALAATFTNISGLLLASLYLFNKIKIPINWIYLLKITFSSSVIYFLSIRIHFSGIMLIAEYIALFVIYGFLVYLLGGITDEDKRILKSFFQSV